MKTTNAMKPFMQSLLALVIAAPFLVGFGLVHRPISASTAADDAFVAAAADAGMLEVQLGKLAAEKGTSQAVKDFGQSMVSDHSKANDELKALAEKKGIKVPATLSAKSQTTYEDISKKTGAAFDKAYAEQMVKDHNEVIEKFKKEAQAGSDPEIKSWANGKVSTLEHHLMMAKDMHSKTSGTK
jgi:putative membrane protein